METFKIAVATPDGQRLSPHFGETPWYEVFTVVDGKIAARERRAKPHNPTHHHGAHEPGQGRGGPHFFDPIRDCRVLIVGGMGERAYQWARNAGLEVVATKGKVDEAVQAYLDGTLQHEPRRIHRSVGGHHA